MDIASQHDTKRSVIRNASTCVALTAAVATWLFPGDGFTRQSRQISPVVRSQHASLRDPRGAWVPARAVRPPGAGASKSCSAADPRRIVPAARLCARPWAVPAFRSGVFVPGAVQRAFTPLIQPLQKRLCRCLRGVPLKAIPWQLRFQLSTTPMGGTAAARLTRGPSDKRQPCLSAVAACVGMVLVSYEPWNLPGCTPGSSATIVSPMRVTLRPAPK